MSTDVTDYSNKKKTSVESVLSAANSLEASSKTEHPPFKTLFREKELWILIGLGLVFFARPLFTGEIFFFRDLYLHFLPQKQLFVQLIRSGTAPLWDPYL